MCAVWLNSIMYNCSGNNFPSLMADDAIQTGQERDRWSPCSSIGAWFVPRFGNTGFDSASWPCLRFFVSGLCIDLLLKLISNWNQSYRFFFLGKASDIDCSHVVLDHGIPYKINQISCYRGIWSDPCHCNVVQSNSFSFIVALFRPKKSIFFIVALALLNLANFYHNVWYAILFENN